jgi:hypothetical protein
MYKQLTDYYISKGISAIHFNCPYFKSCSRTAPHTFTTAKESFISSDYVEHTLPRIVFLSLDSGSAEKDPALKTLESIRKWEEEKENIYLLSRNKHWYRTHELAYTILKNFKPDLRIDQARHYFAHVNSAKCCMNNPQRAQANQILFDNCREFIPGELEILDPNIIITQGRWAKLALEGAFPELEKSDIIPDSLSEVNIIQVNDHPVLWIETFHPRNPSFHTVNRNNYPLYTKVTIDFINQKSSIKMDANLINKCIMLKPPKIRNNQPTIIKEKRMKSTPSSTSTSSEDLTYDEIFEKIIAGLKTKLPGIINAKTEFDHTPNRNRLRIYISKNNYKGSHYEICFRQEYYEFALHFEGGKTQNLEHRQAFEPYLNEVSEIVGRFVRAGRFENQDRMRVWYEHKCITIGEEQIRTYIEEFSRFINVTYPILKKAFSK